MFSPCGIPYAIEGLVESFEDLKHSVPTTRRLQIHLEHEAVEVDPLEKKVKEQHKLIKKMMIELEDLAKSNSKNDEIT